MIILPSPPRCFARSLGQCAVLALVCGMLSLALGHAAARTDAAETTMARYTRQVWDTGNGLPQDTVRQILQTRDGYIWMATDGGLVRFDGVDFMVYDRRNTPGMQSDLINALLEDQDGHLWIATSSGLLKLSGGHFLRYGMAQGLDSDAVLSIREANAGEVCVVTTGGRDCLAGNAFSPASSSRVEADTAPPHAISTDGTQWSVTATGVMRTRHGRLLPVTMPEGFAGSEILTLYVDREGDLWAGSENAGAAILRQPPFSTIGKKDGLAADQVRSLLQDAKGDLWFGTTSGLSQLEDARMRTFTVANGLASDQVIALASTGADDLWIGTPDGLSHRSRGRVTTLTASDGLPDDDIRSLLKARDASLWIGTTHGLVRLDPHSKRVLESWTTASGLPSNVIGSLLEDADGSLWIGTRAGLAHLVHGRLTSYGARDGLTSAVITALGSDAGGTLWIGTSGGGLYEWDGSRLRKAGGALPKTVYGILADGRGSLWLSSAEGIYRIAGEQLPALAGKGVVEMPAALTRYDVADGLRISDTSSGGHPEAMRTADGRLYFATSKGVSIVDPAEVAQHPASPLVALESILVDDVAAGDTHSLRVEAGHERVAFHYAGLSFLAPAKLRYRYQLQPFDQQWIDADARRTAYYTNIPPGTYRFRVQASTDGVAWSEHAAEAAMVIAPHYYQTWWFYGLLAVLLALIAWQLYLYRLREVELRFNAVLAERGRIAREIHDTLAQDIVAISVQLDLVSRLMTLSLDKAKEQLAGTRDLVRKSLAEARSSIWDLRSSGTSGDLPARLRETTRAVVGDAAVKLNLEVTGTYRPAPRALEEELLRIAQEAVTNAVRHAQPGTIDVSLTYNTAGVEVRVHDDGRGFTVAANNAGPPGHYGIRGMHERAERSRARLTIESAPGNGTTVLAKARIG